MAIPFVKEFDDLAEGMVNPPVNRPIARAVANFGRRVCDGISANPGVFAPSVLQSPLRAACQPYWDSLGIDGPTEVTTIPTGQCPVLYRFLWSDAGVPNEPINRSDLIGPMSTPVRIPGFDSLWSVTNGAGNTFNVGRQINLGVSQFDGWQRVDGQPDDCGEPVTTFEPGPSPAPSPGPFEPGTGPVTNIRGDTILNLPTNIEVSPGFNVELPPGEVNLGSGTGNSSPVAPLGAEEVEGENSGNGGADNDFGDPPPGERWIGCCIRLTQIPQGNGGIPQSVPQTIFPNTLGNVRLKFAANSNPVEYDTPINNRQITTCVWEPVRGMNPVGVRVNLLPNFGYTVTPYSVPTEN